MHDTSAVKDKVLAGIDFSLVPFKVEHISDSYIGWLNDLEINRFLEVRFVHQTRETVEAFVRSFYGGTERYMWGIYSKGGEMVGTATVQSVKRVHGTCELGLLIGEKSFWGQGASTEAMELVAEFVFDTLGLRRLTGGSYSANLGMNFTFNRLGWRREGTLREAFLFDGTYIDGYRWAILADEWRKSKVADARTSS